MPVQDPVWTVHGAIQATPNRICACGLPKMRGPFKALREIHGYVGGCQNYGPFLGTLNIRGRIIIGIQKGTIILTTTHVKMYTVYKLVFKLMASKTSGVHVR